MVRILNQKLVVEWHKFKPGTSFFIPCVDRTRVQRHIQKEVRRMKIPNVICKQVVENGVYGLRVWRA